MYGMGKLLPYADLVVYTQTPEQVSCSGVSFIPDP